MCLIVIAHRADARFPFVLAANRDEDYGRPTLPAHFWRDAPNVLGGRDVRQGGSWLALTREGRVAAITNVRGAEKPEGRSRGLLVRDFAQSSIAPDSFARRIDESAYAGFHLIAGIIGHDLVAVSNAGGGVRTWPAGVHGISNGPPGVLWPKVERATAYVGDLIGNEERPGRLATELLSFLGTPGDAAYSRGSTLREEVEGEVFVMSERYGTRSSTVIIASRDEIRFFEQGYGRGGVREGTTTELVMPR